MMGNTTTVPRAPTTEQAWYLYAAQFVRIAPGSDHCITTIVLSFLNFKNKDSDSYFFKRF